MFILFKLQEPYVRLGLDPRKVDRRVVARNAEAGLILVVEHQTRSIPGPLGICHRPPYGPGELSQIAPIDVDGPYFILPAPIGIKRQASSIGTPNGAAILARIVGQLASFASILA